jgi:RecB family exonuclease
VVSRLAPQCFHAIEAELEDDWLSEWTADGIAELETYLKRHAAFFAYLEEKRAAVASSGLGA